jgi:eukaryotic-like serine/threonine-protein kinase
MKEHPGWANVLMAIGLTIVIVILVFIWLNFYTHHNQSVTVPNVKGMTIEQAAEIFDREGLRYDIIDSVSSRDVKPGAIVEVVPSAGSKVKNGRIIFVTINSLTSMLATIPEVADLSARQAMAQLQARGFTNVEIQYINGDYKDLSVDIQLDGNTLAKGEHAPINAHLILRVSNGIPESDVDSISPDSIPVEDVNSADEKWF